MKLMFPGTASGIATATRFHNAILLQSGESRLLLDGGEPLSALLIRKGIDFSTICGMVISHMHPDHAGALPQLLQTMQILRRTAPFRVFMPEEGIAAYRRFLDAVYLFDDALPFACELSPIVSGRTLRVVDWELYFEPNSHLEYLAGLAGRAGLPNRGESYSVAVKKDGKRIVYSGDVRSPLEVAPLLKLHCDCLILEMAHFKPEEYLRLEAAAPPGRTVLTHFHPDIDVAPERKTGELPTRAAAPITFAYDGLEIEV